MLKEVFKLFSKSPNKGLILFFLLILLVPRFVFLDIFPVGIDHDSTELILSGDSIFRFGKDISGVKFYKALFFNKTEAGQAGLPSILLAPILGLLGFSFLKVRILTLVLNIATIFLIAKIVLNFTKDIKLSLIVLFIGVVNPWLFFYSRFPTEAVFSLLFVSLGIYFFFVKGKEFYSLSAFAAAFYSYYGAKPVILLLVPSLILLNKLLDSQKGLNYPKYLGLFLIFVFPFFFLSLAPQSTFKSRQNELAILDLDSYSMMVDEDRRQSIWTPVTTLFSNKAAFIIRDFLRKYTSWLSPSFLFFNGDPSAAHAFEDFGVLHLVDGVFLLLGLLAFGFFKKKTGFKDLYTLIFSVFLIAPAGAVLSKDKSYIFRAHLLPIPLVVLVSLGIYYFLEIFKEGFKGRVVLILLTVAYFLSFFSLLYSYFFRYPVKRQENYFLGERVLASYLKRISDGPNEVVVVGNSPRQLSLGYMLYTNYLKKAKDLPLKEDSTINLGKVTFTSKCPEKLENAVLVVQAGIKCFDTQGLVIQNQKDSGGLFYIINDPICRGYKMDTYRRVHTIRDYKIEDLEDSDFCNRWIARL